MFIDQVDECIYIVVLLEDGAGCCSAAAAFSAVNGGVFLHQFAAVRFAAGAEENCVAWTVNQEENLRNYIEEFLCQIQQVVHSQHFVIEGKVLRLAAFAAGCKLVVFNGLADSG